MAITRLRGKTDFQRLSRVFDVIGWRGCTAADAKLERQRTMVICDQAAMQVFIDEADEDIEAFIIVCMVCDRFTNT